MIDFVFSISNEAYIEIQFDFIQTHFYFRINILSGMSVSGAVVIIDETSFIKA